MVVFRSQLILFQEVLTMISQIQYKHTLLRIATIFILVLTFIVSTAPASASSPESVCFDVVAGLDQVSPEEELHQGLQAASWKAAVRLSLIPLPPGGTTN